MSDIRYGRKRRGIKKELKDKINDWLSTIDDETVVNAIKNDVIVTGGSIASMLLGEKINDYDVYFKTKETTELVARYYVDKFNDKVKLETKGAIPDCSPEVKLETIKNIKGVSEERVIIYMKSSGVAGESQSTYDYFESRTEEETAEFAESLIVKESNVVDTKENKYRPVFMSQNAITLSHKLQLVIRFYGEPEQIHGNYDFVHAMCYYDYKNDVLELSAEAMEALLSRTLKYRGSLYPIASIFRAKKFIERGWRITAGELLKIMWQISEIDLSDLPTLREQLTGVDMAYLYQVIEAVQNINEPEKINSTYIAEIIDRIFD